MEPSSPPLSSDASRLRAWIERRDEAALAELFAGHAPLLRSIAQRVLHDADESADVVQEVLIRLSEHAHTITGEVGPWLRQVAGNTALSHLRSRTRRRVREAETAVMRGEAEDGAGGDGHGDLIAECVASLNPAERALVLRVFWGGEAQGDLARELRVSRVTIHKRLHATLEHLRRQLGRRGLRVAVPALAACLAGLAGQEPQALAWTARRTWPGMAAAAIGALIAAGLAVLAVAVPAARPTAGADRPAAEPAAPSAADAPAGGLGGAARDPARAPAPAAAAVPAPPEGRPGAPRPPWLVPAVQGWRPCLLADWSFWPPSCRIPATRAADLDPRESRCLVAADGAFRVRQPAASMLMVALPMPTDYVDGIQFRFAYRRPGGDGDAGWRDKLLTIVHAPELPGSPAIVALVRDLAEAAGARAAITLDLPAEAPDDAGVMGVVLARGTGPAATIDLRRWRDPRLAFAPLTDAPPWWPLVLLGDGHEFGPILLRPLPAAERQALVGLLSDALTAKGAATTAQ